MKRNLWTMGLLLLMALSVMGCSGKGDLDVVAPEEEIPSALELEAMIEQNAGEGSEQATRELTVYLQDATGYLVPVTYNVVPKEGIAAQALSLLGEEGMTETVADALGLSSILPAGTKTDVDIAGGLATVNLSNEALGCADAVCEYNMIAGIVQTLTEFDSVDKVQFKFNGYTLDSLPFGTNVSEPIGRLTLNVESASPSSFQGQNVTVFFESVGTASMVPVTRIVYSPADIDTAVLELLKGPKDDEGLRSAIPENTSLISVSNRSGVITVNLSGTFKDALSELDGGEAALRAILLTCSQFDGVKEVRIQVEGRALDTDSAVMSRAAVVNSADGSGGMAVLGDLFGD